MDDAEQVWGELVVPWRTAFEEAWASWRAGSLGIGAALVDPSTGEVVSTGRNRTREARSEPGVLAGNFMAHAEMNAIASLPRHKADGLHLYTTLEPCLMCAASIVFMHVETVYFASADPYFADLQDLWDHYPYSRRWKAEVNGPQPQPLAGFSMVLHLTRMAPDNRAFEVLAGHVPDLVELARELIADGTFVAVDEANGSAVDALQAVLGRLPSS